MRYRRMPIEVESPEQVGYETIDCNLSESSVTDRHLRGLGLDLGDLVLCYGHHVGHRGVRELVAADGAGLGPDDVLLTAGAAAALFIISTSLLDPGDRIVVARPNYATNIETPRAIGAEVATLEQRFEDGFRVDLDRLAALITPRTKIVSLTSPHNPTGQVIGEADLRAVVTLCEARGAVLVYDETYREMRLEGGPPPPLAASLSPRAVSVSSLSKTWGLPGIRLGWLICRDGALQETFLAAKEQIQICNSVVDEEIAFRALRRRSDWLPEVRAHIARNFAAVRAWMAREPRMEWIEPRGGVVGFPRIRADARVDVERFYSILQNDLHTLVGPGHWFEQDRRHMRVGFGWPGLDELERGLANVTLALDRAGG